jgi:hypothetical protein
MAARSTLGRWRIGYGGTACPRCKGPLPHERLRSGLQDCPSCRGSFEAVRFDPVQPLVSVPQLAGVGLETASPCARHARNQAVASCTRCGQFMCALCRIDAEGGAYCPGCFDRLSNEGLIPGGAIRIKNYAGYASACVLVNAFIPCAGVIASPIGIYFCVKALGDKKKRNETDGVFRLYILLIFHILIALGCLSFLGLALFGFAMGAKGGAK